MGQADCWGPEAFASAWIYLEEKGGPWLVSPIHDPNIQHPVVIINRENAFKVTKEM
jgi:hypothetical protein